MPITLRFSYPPSANRIWRNIKGRTIKSAEYRDWLFLNRSVSLSTLGGPYRLTILATAPDKRKRDLGNLEKPISDLLQQIGVISDDCNAKEIRMAWVEGPRAGVTVTVEPV